MFKRGEMSHCCTYNCVNQVYSVFAPHWGGSESTVALSNTVKDELEHFEAIFKFYENRFQTRRGSTTEKMGVNNNDRLLVFARLEK